MIIGKIAKSFLKKRNGKVKYQNFFFNLYLASLKGMNIGEGGNLFTSGEIHAMNYVKEHVGDSKTVIFDVGANVGNYAKDLTNVFKNYNIHCFEPAKQTFSRLSENIKDSNIVLNNFGLSDKETVQTLYYDKEGSGLASLYNRQLDYFGIDFSKAETVSLSTLDVYCEKNHIEKIDFLKMDVEGNELNLLKGAESMLKNKMIGAIQIEFGGCNLDSRTYIRDFWNILHDDYKMFRIVKDGLYEVMSYQEQLEIFTCSNYFFARK